MERQKDIINYRFRDEYKLFLEKYLLRLLGVPSCKVTVLSENSIGKDVILEEDGKLFFLAQIGAEKLRMFSIDKPQLLSDDNIRLAKCVINAFFAFAKNRAENVRDYEKNTLVTKARRDKIYNMAIQVGICRWITDADSDTAEELFHILEQWAVKTYEGRNVTMGFVIDPEASPKERFFQDDWFSFLKDDYAAVISDCIHSVFVLDRDCKFAGYRSISDEGAIPKCSLNERVPLRFLHTIQQFVPKDQNKQRTKKVGIFLLSNGDILLAKNGAIRFVKRNMQWLNLSYDAFKNALQDFIKANYSESKLADAEDLISSVYSSVLDVSFSHTGGIISIVDQTWETPNSGNKKPVDEILSKADNLLLADDDKATALWGQANTVTPEDQKEYAKTESDRKKSIKRSIIKSLVEEKKFTELDRKLRSELIALDGACILGLDGSIYSFGAIIQNDSGSTGGARAAAAKKLSKYGIAVKVSTDGYIELYIEGQIKYIAK